MKIYLAPLQGLTDYIFREAFCQTIGEFDKYFSPFIRVQNNRFYRPSQLKDLLPENNINQKPIPQFLGNTVDDFMKFEEVCLGYGYDEFNINLGCPYPMVTNRNFGAGILTQPELVDELLSGVFKNSNRKVSVKCRLGNTDPNEFSRLVPILNAYPLHEVIIHPRVANQLYDGSIYFDRFIEYLGQLQAPVIFNGDIITNRDLIKIYIKAPDIEGIMIGRGILSNLYLLDDINDVQNPDNLIKAKAFYYTFLELCYKKYSGDSAILKRLVEMWKYHSLAFPRDKIVLKAVKKCRNINDYKRFLDELHLFVDV